MLHGDLVVDLDAIMAALSLQPHYDKPACLLGAGLHVKDSLLDWIAGTEDRVRHAWVITSGAAFEERKDLRRRFPSCSVVVLEVPSTECLRRISQDGRRKRRWQKWQPIIERWWREYVRSEEDEHLTGVLRG